MNSVLTRKICIYVLPAIALAALTAYFTCFTKNEEAKPEIKQEELSQLVESPAPSPEIQTEEEMPAPPPQSPQAEEQKESAPAEPAPDDLAKNLCSNELWNLLTQGDYVQNFILFIDEISLGYIPAKTMSQYRSKTPFTAVNRDGEWFLSPETIGRYEKWVDLFCAIDPEKAGVAYKALMPAFQNKMKELGYINKTTDELLTVVMENLRGIPLYENDMPMEKVSEHIYQWKDPALEKLMPVQKFLLRIGQKNLYRIRKQAESFAAFAGIE